MVVRRRHLMHLATTTTLQSLPAHTHMHTHIQRPPRPPNPQHSKATSATQPVLRRRDPAVPPPATPIQPPTPPRIRAAKKSSVLHMRLHHSVAGLSHLDLRRNRACFSFSLLPFAPHHLSPVPPSLLPHPHHTHNSPTLTALPSPPPQASARLPLSSVAPETTHCTVANAQTPAVRFPSRTAHSPQNLPIKKSDCQRITQLDHLSLTFCPKRSLTAGELSDDIVIFTRHETDSSLCEPGTLQVRGLTGARVCRNHFL